MPRRARRRLLVRGVGRRRLRRRVRRGCRVRGVRRLRRRPLRVCRPLRVRRVRRGCLVRRRVGTFRRSSCRRSGPMDLRVLPGRGLRRGRVSLTRLACRSRLVPPIRPARPAVRLRAGCTMPLRCWPTRGRWVALRSLRVPRGCLVLRSLPVLPVLPVRRSPRASRSLPVPRACRVDRAPRVPPAVRAVPFTTRRPCWPRLRWAAPVCLRRRRRPGSRSHRRSLACLSLLALPAFLVCRRAPPSLPAPPVWPRPAPVWLRAPPVWLRVVRVCRPVPRSRPCRRVRSRRLPVSPGQVSTAPVNLGRVSRVSRVPVSPGRAGPRRTATPSSPPASRPSAPAIRPFSATARRTGRSSS